jgi:hypothetical protein
MWEERKNTDCRNPTWTLKREGEVERWEPEDTRGGRSGEIQVVLSRNMPERGRRGEMGAETYLREGEVERWEPEHA